MPFDVHGFLGEQVKVIGMKEYEEHKDLFELVIAINKYAQEMKYKFVIHNEDSQELTIGALYIKALQSFESVVILSRLGLNSDSKAVLRVLLEAVFYLKAICEDDNFVFTYIKGDDVELHRILKKISKDEKGIFSTKLKEYASKDKIDNLKSVIWKKNENPLEIYKVAEKAGMSDFYQLVYGSLCDNVHTSVRSLEKYYGINESGRADSLDGLPNFADMDVVIVTACSILLVALSCTEGFFELNCDGDISILKEKLMKFNRR